MKGSIGRKYWVNNHAYVIDSISLKFLKYLGIYINSISLEAYVTGAAQPNNESSKNEYDHIGNSPRE
jgi:type I restriction enzyme S subunit